jgi:hypothetical protein
VKLRWVGVPDFTDSSLSPVARRPLEGRGVARSACGVYTPLLYLGLGRLGVCLPSVLMAPRSCYLVFDSSCGVGSYAKLGVIVRVFFCLHGGSKVGCSVCEDWLRSLFGDWGGAPLWWVRAPGSWWCRWLQMLGLGKHLWIWGCLALVGSSSSRSDGEVADVCSKFKLRLDWGFEASALAAFTRFGLLHRRLERSSFLTPVVYSSAADVGVGGQVCFLVWSLLSLLYFLFFQRLGCNRGCTVMVF